MIHQAIDNDAAALWVQTKDKWCPPVVVNAPAEHDRVIKTTVFGQKWGTFVFDEVHAVRTFNRLYMAAAKLGDLADLRIGLSATPGITTPMVSDVYSFGHC